MTKEKFIIAAKHLEYSNEIIQGIPAIIYGEPSDKLYLYIHGKSGALVPYTGAVEVS